MNLSRGVLRGNKLQSSINEGEPLIMWYNFAFQLPECSKDVWYPYHLRLEQNGNGFIYVNGHCIGRCWQDGPQREYYIPECWLNMDGENLLTISLRPVGEDAAIRTAEIIPVTWVADAHL